MPRIVEASAPGKIILFGEHAVVYGQPALAVPLTALRATALISPGVPGDGLRIRAQDLNVSISLAEGAAHGLALTARLVLDRLGAPEPDAEIAIRSTIPIASGLGSGAAVSAALARALAIYLGQPLDNAALSDLVYEVEKVHHGTPSGIDNTVICHAEPVYFIKGQPPQVFHTQHPFTLVVGDTGIASPTRETVGAVRAAWQREPALYNGYFEQIGVLVREARTAIEAGKNERLGPLMDRNQALLEQIGVSSPELEHLVQAARDGGALGAKLSGGGRGGNMIALVTPDHAGEVSQALRDAGARHVLITTVH